MPGWPCSHGPMKCGSARAAVLGSCGRAHGNRSWKCAPYVLGRIPSGPLAQMAGLQSVDGYLWYGWQSGCTNLCVGMRGIRKEVVTRHASSRPCHGERSRFRDANHTEEALCMAEQTRMPMKREDMAPRRWDPFEMFETLQEEMDRFWRRPGPFWAGAFPSFFRRPAGQG
jgi:hypothetical protein